MKILGLIPARGGSKGIPGKNIKMLAGKPLIVYSIEVALSCELLSEVLVSTDDETIAQVSRKAGASVPFLRPAELATDQSPTIDTVVHALKYFEAQGQRFDAVCLLQPTSPFRNVTDLQQAIAHFQAEDADSLISVRAVPHHYNPHWVFEKETDSSFLKIATGEKEIIPRRQELPKAYHRDGAIYISKSEIVLTNRSLYGQKITYYLMTDQPNINIDHQSDWEAAESAMHNFKSNG